MNRNKVIGRIYANIVGFKNGAHAGIEVKKIIPPKVTTAEKMY